MNCKFRTLTANDVEARVQSVDEKGLILLIYKNARVDQSILDETVGPENWQRDHKEIKGNLYCGVSIWDDDKIDWVTKWDCGSESNTEKEKGEASDSFKRACFNWGIGRELYTSPKIKIKGHTVKTDKKDARGKEIYRPEYYEFNVTKLEVSEERKIIALQIIGKSMEDGYHEDVIFNWEDKSKTSTKKAPASENQTQGQKTTSNTKSTTTAPESPVSAPEELDLSAAGEIIVNFGKYKGLKLKEIDNDYLAYLADRAYDEVTKKAAQMILEHRKSDDEPLDFDEVERIQDDLPF